jgi:hypothetical protein
LKVVVLRALNNNQILILSNANGLSGITALLQDLSDRYKIPLSTLKLNAQILKKLGLISFNGSPAELTESGELMIKIINK